MSSKQATAKAIHPFSRAYSHTSSVPRPENPIRGRAQDVAGTTGGMVWARGSGTTTSGLVQFKEHRAMGCPAILVFDRGRRESLKQLRVLYNFR